MSPRGTGKKVENLEAKIVILGGGGGGLAAAVAAAEKGATGIIVLEKRRHLGGNSALAHGLFACESPVQKREIIDCRKDECFKIAMKWAHWGRLDPRIVRAFIDKSGDTIRWLEGKGLKFEIKTVYPNQLRVWHNPVGFGARLMKVLVKNCEDMGVQLLLGTSGKRILREAKGNITGVVAVNEGVEFEIKARSVIIATGGFGGNTELLKKYCPPYYDSMRLLAVPLAGDGLLMAAEIGAAIADSIPILKEGPVPDISGFMKMGDVGGIVKEPYTVWVNKRGKRFIDEAAGFMVVESGNAILLQPDKVSYTLFDDQIRQDMEEKGLLMGRGRHEDAERRGIPGLEKALQRKTKESNGNLVKISDSWDGIASWIGADPKVLKATIDEYNSFCDHGYDEVFAKDRRYLLPLRRTPYYAIRCCGGFIDTLGGIKVNEHMEVRDTQDNIIAGLYAAGVIADGFESDTPISYVLCGSTFGFAINSGRIAGENAAKFVLGE